MKKLLSLSFLCMICLHAFCQSPFANETIIEWQVGIVHPTVGGKPTPKSPITPPEASLADHTLYINIGHDMTIVLLDDNGDEVFSAYVPAGTTAVVLPSSLSGTYELQLLPDGSSYYFYSEIEV